MTNNFDLTTKNATGVTLAQAYCNEFPNFAKKKLTLNLDYFCWNYDIYISSKYYSKALELLGLNTTQSQQELECVHGKVFLS